jgi:peroxiredoxin
MKTMLRKCAAARALVLLAAAVALLSAPARAQQSQTAARTATNSAAAAAKGDGGGDTGAPKVGQAAPDFRLPYATQEQVYLKPEEYLSLSGQRGKNVILAFYPADWSGGCTKEVCTLRDTFAELSKLNATVMGISGDYVFSHQEWAKFHQLQFPLLSDHDHKVARLYASYNEGAGYNNRTVFLVDKEGVVRYVNMQFKAGDPADYNRLREELAKLK